jgi:hypothetical protein
MSTTATVVAAMPTSRMGAPAGATCAIGSLSPFTGHTAPTEQAVNATRSADVRAAQPVMGRLWRSTGSVTDLQSP